MDIQVWNVDGVALQGTIVIRIQEDVPFSLICIGIEININVARYIIGECWSCRVRKILQDHLALVLTSVLITHTNEQFLVEISICRYDELIAIVEHLRFFLRQVINLVDIPRITGNLDVRHTNVVRHLSFHPYGITWESLDDITIIP